MSDYKFKKDDLIVTASGRIGRITKAEKDTEDIEKNKYSVEYENGEVIILNEFNIRETEWKKNKEK